jgi:chromosome segregation ATPase
MYGPMQRVHVPFDGPTMAQIDLEVEKSGVSRAQWLSSAVAQYLAHRDAIDGPDLANLAHDLAQQKTEYEKLWRESQQLKRDIATAKKSEETARTDMGQLTGQLGPLKDQLAAATTELETSCIDMGLLKKDLAHAMDTIRSRDQQIAFYEAQIANLVQSLGQLAIKPGQEETKKKGWWKFWRKE